MPRSGVRARARPRHGGTRFILPWATDPDSELRTRLGIEAIAPEAIEDLATALCDFIPKAFLFLQKLESAEVRRNGKTLVHLERVREGQQVILEQDGEAREWRIFTGDFAVDADDMRARGQLAVADRRTTVSVAIPEDPEALDTGYFYAFLPT